MKRHRSNSPARMNLYLPSVRLSVSGEDVLDDPVLAALVVEDTCWCIARDDWLARHPHRWRRRKVDRHQAEHQQLCDQRDEVRSLARHCGLLAD